LKTRRLLVTILVLALVAVYYLMVSDYFKQRRDNQVLASRTEEVAQLLTQVPPSPSDLEQRLSAAESLYAETQNSFPDPLSTTQIINAVLSLADDTGVKAIPLVTQPWTVESVGDYDYSVFRLSVTATGEFTEVADFIDGLESGEPPTLIITSLIVDRVTGTPGDDNSLPVEARLEIAVYARPLATDEVEKAE
jgi:hypothetical protein